jgi:PKD repeat protein
MNKGKAYFVFLCLVFIFLIFQSSYAADVLSGRVYEGNTGTEPPTAKTLSGVTVTLYGSNNEDNLGSQITSTTTNSEGWYGLTAPEGYEFYSIVESDPSGYYSVGATSVSGTVVSNNRIRYSIASAPLSAQTLTGNKFWDKPTAPANNPPVALANGPYSGTVRNAVTLDGSGSYDPDSGDSIAGYAWDLDNDGLYDDATGATPSYTWNSAATYLIWLKVTDTHGATDTDSAWVYIESQPQPCSAAFIADTRQGCAPLTVNFTDQSGNAQSWYWTFPGGTPSSSTQQNPTIVYSSPGTYWVKLKIKCTSGQVDSVIKVDYVVAENCPQACEAAFDAEPRKGCTPLTVNFTDLSSNAQSRQWKFPGGNPSSSTSQNPKVIYNNPGTFSVFLKIICESGAEDSIINVDYITARECGDSLDFGDAPDSPYPTLLNSNGARHVISPNLYLGTGVDPDANGQPSAQADGDDKNITFPGIPYPSGDEDGVQIAPIVTTGMSVPVTVFASASGVVNAWLDLDGNGCWADAGEHIIAAQPVTAGANTFTLTIPAAAQSGQSYARFRLSSVRNLGYDGPAPDGEVEDYPVVIQKAGEGKLTIIKDATPKDDTPFWISVVYGIHGGSAPYRDPSNNTSVISNAPTGIYNIGEFVPTGWTLTDIVVSGDNDNGSNIDVANGTVDVDLDANEDITVVFKNGKTGEEDIYDFGDAPDAANALIYPTLRTNNGAYHDIINGFHLGALIDAEPDGVPTPDAMGDDNLNLDDEDGVSFSTPLIPGQPAVVEVTASSQGNLNAWIDFNANQSWGDANEHIFADVALSSGNKSLNFTVPPSAKPGQTFARFRLSRVTGISFTGYGHGGEVEDYELFIEEGEGGPPLKWNQIPLLNEDPDMAWTPCFNGWDVKTVFDGTFIADDWFCKSPRPVTFIHWWGSYVDWDSTVAPHVAPHAFHIGIWTDVPAGEDKEWSHPGTMIWHWMVPRDALEERVAGDDFHPAYMSKPDTCFEYHFDIPKDEWFYQQGDSTVYWLSIAAVYEEVPDEFVWGWKTREHFFQDDAVYVYVPVQPEIGDIAIENEPIDQGWDLAFVLGTDEYVIDYDFGDAPADRYPTFFGQNGALHIIDPTVFLGRRIDAEADGQPNHSATGDDMDGSNDDDGIVFISPTTPGGTVTLEVTASVNGYLNGWMDFDNNGSWADADEQIFIDEPLPGGLSTFTISVPDDAVPHEIFSRFRFSTVPGLPFVGIAIDGEVEDYYVNLKATAVEDQRMDETLPASYILYQNYPNPFNPDTEIAFALPEPSVVKIMIFNTSGQFIKTLTSRHYAPGTHRVIWNGRDKEDISVASGLYFYVMQAGGRIYKKKMLLIK